MSADPIQNFFHDQEVFITGATGLIGKSVVEKLLRSCPGLKKVYLLLRTKRGKCPKDRLEEMKKSEVFDRIRNEGKGDVLNKLVGLRGDIGELKLGLADDDINRLQNVSVIFHIAATIRFDEPIQRAIFQNIRATREALLIAEKLKNLKKFVHCSTAYSNPHLYTVKEKIYRFCTNWEECIKIAEKYDEVTLDILGPKLLGTFPNSYTFSKHVAEHLVNSFKERVPVVIYRPAIVTNAIQEPFEGWYDSFMGAMGLFATIGTGLVRVTETRITAHFDFVPLDITAILMIMVAWKDHSLPPLKPDEDVRVYHLCSRKYQPYTIGELAEKYVDALENRYPFQKTLWYPRVAFSTNKLYIRLNIYLFHLLPGIILDALLRLFGHEPLILKIHRKIVASNAVLGFFTRKTYDFECARMDSLLVESKDFDEFNYAFAIDVDPDESLVKCAYGIRRYVLKESDDSLPNAFIRFRILKWLDRIFYFYIYYWLARKLLIIFANYLPTTDLLNGIH